MGRNIPVPAESLRTLAEDASEHARNQRDSGNRFNARGIESDISQAFEALDARHGEFVSIDASAVSTLAAFSTHGVPDVDRHREAAVVFLRQYGVWGNSE